MPVLYVEDAARALAWYERLGFAKEWEHQFEPGFPWFVSVARSNVRLYLSEHKGDARPDTLIHLYVKNIDDVAKEFGVAVDEEGLAGRECALVDPDGNHVAARPAPTSSAGKSDASRAFSTRKLHKRLHLAPQRPPRRLNTYEKSP